MVAIFDVLCADCVLKVLDDVDWLIDDLELSVDTCSIVSDVIDKMVDVNS
jgi:hypothetical protein